MADFRKSFLVLAALVLIFGTGSAFAQSAMQCTANAGVPPLLRAEGVTELVGDISLNCVGGTATPVGTAVPQANIQVFLNAAATSRLVSSSGQSEAVLLIDEPAPAAQFLCGSLNGCTYAGGAAAGAGKPNVYQGQISGTQSVLFLGVPIDPPGSTGTRVIRITNIRANASAVAPGGSGTPGQVVGLISSSSLPINNPQQVLGYVQSGLTFGVNSVAAGSITLPVSLAQCTSLNTTTTGTRTSSYLIRFSENFATAFKTRTVAVDATGATAAAPAAQATPGQTVNAANVSVTTESGFYNPALTAPYNIAGLADNGTRLTAIFNNVPAGVTLFVGAREFKSGTAYSSTTVSAANITAEANAFFASPVVGATPAYSSNAIAVGAVVQLPAPVNGSVSTTWEITGASALALEDVFFPVWINYTASPNTNAPALGTATVAGRFGVVSTTSAASQLAQLPRFVDSSKATNVFSTKVCVTNLMFPFVTNQAGFDTGLAIANTTLDPFGTKGQTGNCSLTFYGASAPAAALDSGAVAAGTVYTTLASSVAPNFQGYVIAVCNFQYGHGFAFVSDLGAQKLAMGYLANVMSDSGRSNNAVNPGIASAGNGEVLGQ